MSHPYHRDIDVDAIVESVLARVGLDSLPVRNPAAVLMALGWTLDPLVTLGPEEGRVVEADRVAFVRLVGSRPSINRVIAHEVGHIVFLEFGYPLPHCECCVDAAGRAICLGRQGLSRRLRTDSPQTIIASLAHLFTTAEVARRIFEVRAVEGRRAG
jgi:hypothetical protein